MEVKLRKNASIYDCMEAAKDNDLYDSGVFDLVGPQGRKKARWLDAYFGMFMLDGSDSFLLVRDVAHMNVWCENLRSAEEPTNA